MEGEIFESIRDIENKHQVKVVYACESGSRAWGFPSQDSDYDVRFIYVCTVDRYLSVFEQRDVIEEPITDLLDVNGWDLKKALKLMYKSNPALLEWLQSPIVYVQQYTVADKLREISEKYFSGIASFHHYYSMAKGNYRKYLQGDEVKIKKYFYVLRPIFACMWILKYGNMPPMLFDELMGGVLEDAALMADVQQLLERKRAGEEMDLEPPIPSIKQFIEFQFDNLTSRATELKTAHSKSINDLEKLFQNSLSEVWGRHL